MTEIEKEIANYYLIPELIWDKIPIDTVEKMRENLTVANFKKDEQIYTEGFHPRGLYIVKKGIAKQFLISNEGKEQIIYMLKPGNMFGYRSIVCNNASFLHVTAIQDCEIEIIGKDTFVKYFNESNEIKLFFLNYFGMEFRVLFNKISFFATKPVTERVALTLLILNQKFEIYTNDKNGITFTRTDLACFAGTINETLSRQLTILEKEDIIELRGRAILIKDKERLFKIANI